MVKAGLSIQNLKDRVALNVMQSRAVGYSKGHMGGVFICAIKTQTDPKMDYQSCATNLIRLENR
jgi:hypothetical protein